MPLYRLLSNHASGITANTITTAEVPEIERRLCQRAVWDSVRSSHVVEVMPEEFPELWNSPKIVKVLRSELTGIAGTICMLDCNDAQILIRAKLQEDRINALLDAIPDDDCDFDKHDPLFRIAQINEMASCLLKAIECLVAEVETRRRQSSSRHFDYCFCAGVWFYPRNDALVVEFDSSSASAELSADLAELKLKDVTINAALEVSVPEDSQSVARLQAATIQLLDLSDSKLEALAAS